MKFDESSKLCRRFGASVGILALLSIFWGCGKPEISEGTRIGIVYSNDTHGKLQGCGCEHRVGGILKRSNRLKSLRAKDPTILYFDAGNFLVGNPEADTTQGRVIIAVYNELGSSVVNISEVELEQGLEVFNARRREAKFDFVSANITASGKSLAPPYVVKQVKGLDIAFVGLCASKKVMRSDSTKLPSDIQVKDPIEAARQVIPSLSKKVDLLVVLSTCGDAVDSALAATFPMIDVIIGGRTYRSNAAKPWKVGNTTIARAQRDGRSLGRLEFEFAHDRTIKSVAPLEELMDADAATDPSMLELVRKFVPDFSDESNENNAAKSPTRR